MVNDYVLDIETGMYYSDTLNDWLTPAEYQTSGKTKCDKCDCMLFPDEICWGFNH